MKNFEVFADPVTGALLPARLCCYKSYQLAGSAVIPPPTPALIRKTLASMSVSARTQLLLFLISLSSIVGRSRFIEVRVLTVKSLLAAAQKFKKATSTVL